jgi:tetratricopeptide (TPR) repeat protein
MSSKRSRNRRKDHDHAPPAILNASRVELAFAKELERWEGWKPRNRAADQAVELVEQAELSERDEESERLAREAIRLWPDCIEAYELLAERSSTAEQALPHYERAMAAGERRLKELGISLEDDGALTGNIVGYVYLRARRRYADCLLRSGRTEEALEHYAEALRLDEDDPVMARFPLALAMVVGKKFDLLRDLLKQYDWDRSSTWLVTRALLEYLKEGDSWSARKMLNRAKGRNRRIVELLLSPEEVLPDGWEDGPDAEKYVEAVFYAEEFASAWQNVPGALEWLTKH